MDQPVEISSLEQLDYLIHTSTVVVCDFYADWCSPCKVIAPVYEQLSTSLSRPNLITFAKVNTDVQKDVAAKYAISALPTFMVFKEGKTVEKILGADRTKLERVVRDLADIAATSTPSSTDEWHKPEVPKGYIDVTDQIELKGVELLNVDSEFGSARVLFEKSKPSALDSKGKTSTEDDGKDWVESDTDEQLMLYIPFHSRLKIHTLQITSLPPAVADGDTELPMRPKTINFYTNRPQILGFEEAEDVTATQTVTIGTNDWDAAGTANIATRFVRFQNVTSLVLFVVDGDGNADRVRLDRIRVIGEVGEKRDLGKLEKIGEDHE